jgi:hypothetical protein
MPKHAPPSTLSIAIVGNGPIIIDHGALIDSTSLVVRFNHLDNLKVGTGSRLDVWVIASHPWLLERFVATHIARSQQPLPTVEQLAQSRTRIWFPIPPVPSAIASRHILPTYAHRMAAIKRFMSSVLQDFTTPELVTFEPCYYNDLSPDTWPPECVMPSNGYLVARSIVESAEFATYRKLAIGFSWAGWPGHPWKCERAYFLQLARRNKLSIITTQGTV